MSSSQLDQTTPPPPPPREEAGHKGTFGTVAIVGGCAGPQAHMIGAPVLAGRAALRGGAGLVRLVMPGSILDAGLSQLVSATGVPLAVEADGAPVPHLASQSLDTLLGQCDALVVGPGLGQSPGSAAIVLRALGQERVPVVLDADGLNTLAQLPQALRDWRAPAILTPHPGEFARLARETGITADPVDPQTRPDAARALAQRLGCVVVLKGAGSVVSDGQRTWICPEGHPCLATAGTGDVLAGLLGALAARAHAAGRGAQSLDLYNAARLGVLVHARAARAWASSHKASAGLLASELADALPGQLWPA